MMHEKKFFTTNLNVRFRDLDAMGHVNNAVFFTYFEQGRLDFFNSAVSAGAFPGFEFILAHISCDYLKPVTIDDRLTLQIRVGKIGRKSFNFSYAIVDRADANCIYATGESVQVCFDYRQNKTLQVSGELKDLLNQYLI
ncbi:MAG: acyl-CoA thioesterase [Deltaproteobacteria bacterium]|nr:acyl-CoA thioesterase [Deltaproteobacteria bacterium]